MKDIERRLLATQRSLSFAEAETGDFVALHSELDPRISILKQRKCGTVIKKSDNILYIKLHGTDDIITIKKGDPHAITFDLPRFHRHEHIDQSTHIIKLNGIVFIVNIKADGKVDIRNNSHTLLLEVKSLSALPINTHSLLLQLKPELYICITDKIELIQSSISDVSFEDNILQYKKSEASKWLTTKTLLYDPMKTEYSKDIQLFMYKKLDSIIAKF